MKALSLLIILSAITSLSCRKSASGTDPSNSNMAGTWELAEKGWSFGVNSAVAKPAMDSSVLLVLNRDHSYVTELNEKIISQGSYSISPDSAYYNKKVLQLNNFRKTGIFDLLTIKKIGTNGQILSSFNGLFAKISNDSLTLSTVLTPGGFALYIFIRR